MHSSLKGKPRRKGTWRPKHWRLTRRTDQNARQRSAPMSRSREAMSPPTVLNPTTIAASGTSHHPGGQAARRRDLDGHGEARTGSGRGRIQRSPDGDDRGARIQPQHRRDLHPDRQRPLVSPNKVCRRTRFADELAGVALLSSRCVGTGLAGRLTAVAARRRSAR